MTTVRFSGNFPLLAAMQLNRAAKPQAGQTNASFQQAQSHPADSYSFTAASAHKASHNNDVLFGAGGSKKAQKTLRISDLRPLQNFVHQDGAEVLAEDLNRSGSRANYYIRTDQGLRRINSDDLIERAAFERAQRREQRRNAEAALEPTLRTEPAPPPPPAPIQVAPLEGWVTREGGFPTFVNRGRSSRDDRFFVRDSQDPSGFREIERRELADLEEWQARQEKKGKSSMPVRPRSESSAAPAAESSRVSRRDLDPRRDFTTKLGEDVFKHTRNGNYYARNEDGEYIKIERGDLLKKEKEKPGGVQGAWDDVKTEIGKIAKGVPIGVGAALAKDATDSTLRHVAPKREAHHNFTSRYGRKAEADMPPADVTFRYQGYDLTTPPANPNNPEHAAIVFFESSEEGSLNSNKAEEFGVPRNLKHPPQGPAPDHLRVKTKSTYVKPDTTWDDIQARTPADGDGDTAWIEKEFKVTSNSSNRDFLASGRVVRDRLTGATRREEARREASQRERLQIVDAPAEEASAPPAAPPLGPDIHDRPEERRRERDREPSPPRSRDSHRSHRPSRRSGTRPARESRSSTGTAPQGERRTNEDYPHWSEEQEMPYRWRMRHGRRTSIREYENGNTQDMSRRDNN